MSQNHKDVKDVMAGAAGFVAGAILVAAGVLSLTIQSRSAATREAAERVVRCLAVFLPPASAALVWPVAYFWVDLWCVAIMPVVLLGCVIWAGLITQGVASNLAALLGTARVRVLWAVVFAVQVVAILASWDLFGWFLQMLLLNGYHVGWS
jgi:hypothetical protein